MTVPIFRAALPAPEPLHQARKRDWFLRGSTWRDVVWVFAPSSLLEEDHPVRIRWDFRFSHRRRFTDPALCAAAGESAGTGPGADSRAYLAFTSPTTRTHGAQVLLSPAHPHPVDG